MKIISLIRNKAFNVQQVIHGNPTPGTLGDYWLMIEENRRLDSDWIDNYPNKWRRVCFNYDFSYHMLNNFKELHCEFCDKKDLKLYKWFEPKDTNIMSTVDHFVAQMHDKNLIEDPSNLFISCNKCNQKKGEKTCDQSVIKFRYDDLIRSSFKFDEAKFKEQEPFKI